MKNGLIGFLAVIFLILLAIRIFTYYHPPTTSPLNNSVSPTASVVSLGSTTFCSPTVLQPQIETEPAAGNIWGVATIANNGSVPCQIIGNNFLDANVDPSINNITLSTQGSAGSEILTLAPGQTVYSQIHYPNGPQCSGTPNQTNITFTYKISTKDLITFHALDGKTTFSIPSCQSSKEVTDIQIWPISDQPITK